MKPLAAPSFWNLPWPVTPEAMTTWTRTATTAWLGTWTLPIQQAVQHGLAAQGQMLDIVNHSAQTIGLRLLLAPPWMVAHPWVRREWHDMTAEKGVAMIDAMMGAAMAAWPWAPDSSARVMAAMLKPYDAKTRSNSARLGSEALARAITGRIGGAAPRRSPSRRRRTA